MFELRQIAAFFLLAGSVSASAALEEILETPDPVIMSDDAAQLCFQNASNVPDFDLKYKLKNGRAGNGKARLEKGL